MTCWEMIVDQKLLLVGSSDITRASARRIVWGRPKGNTVEMVLMVERDKIFDGFLVLAGVDLE